MSYASVWENQRLASQPVSRRAAILFVVVLLHIFLILVLVLSRPAVTKQSPRGLSVFSLAAAATIAPPIPIALPVIPATSEPANPSPAEIFAEQKGAEGDPDGLPCSPIDSITARLANDPAVPVAINRVPKEERSISEAIVMWNANWSIAAATPDAPLAEVRDRVVLILSELPPDCLAMPVIGPRLIAISEEGYTTFLAFGSGEWSWQQLIYTQDPVSSENNDWTWKQLISGDFPTTF